MSYTIERLVHGTSKMSNGLGTKTWEEPTTTAVIRKDGRVIARVRLNACLLCLPEGGVQAMDASDEQIVAGVLGDEHIFSGTPTFPEHHDDALTA